MPNIYNTINWGLLGEDKGGRIPLNLNSPPEEVKEVGKEITYEFFNKVYLKNKKVFNDMLTYVGNQRDIPYQELKEAKRRPLGWLSLFAYVGVPNEKQELQAMHLPNWRKITTDKGYGGSSGKWFKANVISPLICEVWNKGLPVWARVLIGFHTQYKVAWLQYGARDNVLRYMEISVHSHKKLTPNTVEAKRLTEHFIHWLRRNNQYTCRTCGGEGSIEPHNMRLERLWSMENAYDTAIPHEYICGRCNGIGQVY